MGLVLVVSLALAFLRLFAPVQLAVIAIVLLVLLVFVLVLTLFVFGIFWLIEAITRSDEPSGWEGLDASTVLLHQGHPSHSRSCLPRGTAGGWGPSSDPGS